MLFTRLLGDPIAVRGEPGAEHVPAGPEERPDLVEWQFERPPICPTCGVTLVPASLSAREEPVDDWICLECEETSDPNM